MVPPPNKFRGIEELISPHLAELKGYVPIVPPEVLAGEYGVAPQDVIKLDGNENPYGCSPRVQRALAASAAYHVYPDPEQRELRAALSGYVGAPAENIVVGSGSDELIDLVLRLFLSPGDKVINSPPTFGMYSFNTGVCGGQLVEVPRQPGDFAVDVPAIKAAVDGRTKVIFVASPNNPTGNTTSEQDILELLSTGVVVVVDEAYFEFSGKTVAGLVRRHDNLIVLRTFSKWAGLAGLRVGYGIFSAKVTPHVLTIKSPYNVNVAGQIAALESLRDLEHLRRTVQAIVAERHRLFAGLERLGFLQPAPSEGNFILCRLKRGNAETMHGRLQRRGIFLRHFSTALLQDCIRISVGKPEHSDVVLRALGEVLEP